jgi:outer membrane receptor protein involved in Fe transport
MWKRLAPLTGACLLLCSLAQANIFGSLRGIVHDPQHRPVAGAEITVRSATSQWKRSAASDGNGEFHFDAVPVGSYVVRVSAPGFAVAEQTVAVHSGSAPILHFPLSLPTVASEVVVSAAPETINPESSTLTTTISRQQVERTPGADRSNSLAMITDYVPGAYLIHNQLHIRGGHQVSWLLDGVPVPNTNIASNVGPQFDPKDIDYIEVQRGGYSAEYGDRTFGVFNVVTRSGFERNREGELVLSYGSFHSTNNQLSFGSHSNRFAYYASLNGNRTDLGLETPTPQVLHDLASGLGGFANLIFNATPNDQLRLVTAVRGDHYQVSNTPEQQAAGIRDIQRERDALVNLSWVHTAGSGLLLTVSPFYHFNRAAYLGGPNDMPVIPRDERASHYAGGQVALAITRGKHNARFGLEGFAQRDNHLFGLTANDGSGTALRQRELPGGNLQALFVEEQYKATSWLTVNGGVRLTRFSGGITETVADPRVGAAIQLPRVGWVVRGFYGRYYQPPPLSTVSGPLLELVLDQGFGFLPLRGEKDEQYQVGLSIPAYGWVLDADYFHTKARNFFDHDPLGNSNIFFPLTLEGARIHGWEASLRSPRIASHMQFHLAYAHQFVQGRGGVSGGLTEFQPPEDNAYYFLDHDQRDTLSTGVNFSLPGKAWAAGNISYGSGFLDGDGPAHLPGHTTLDFSLGKSFGENLSLQFTALNLTNHRYLLDNSNTFGGTHYANPRELAVQVRYRFHY